MLPLLHYSQYITHFPAEGTLPGLGEHEGKTKFMMPLGRSMASTERGGRITVEASQDLW